MSGQDFLGAVLELDIHPESWVPQAAGWVQTHGDGPHDGIGLVKWDRDGISWHNAPAPAKEHKHYVQTYGVISFKQVFRCPCGAIGDNIYRSWMLLDPPRVGGLLGAGRSG